MNIKFFRQCVVLCFTPTYGEKAPEDVTQEDLLNELRQALNNDDMTPAMPMDLKVWGARGASFNGLPPGMEWDEARDGFDKHVIEALFGEKVAAMAASPAGRLALLAVCQQAQQEDDAAAAASDKPVIAH